MIESKILQGESFGLLQPIYREAHKKLEDLIRKEHTYEKMK